MNWTPKQREDARAEVAALPLAIGQSEIWLAQKLAPARNLFNVAGYVEISGAVDREAFVAALRAALCEAGSPLMSFRESGTGVQQLPAHARDVHVRSLDLTEEADPRAAAMAWMEADMAKPFDLTAGPICRFALLQVRGDRVLWYSAFHHLVMDFMGAWALKQRAAGLYEAAVGGRDPPPGTLTHWSEVVRDESEYRHSDRLEKDRSYWRERLHQRPGPATLSGLPPAWPDSVLSTRATVPGAAMTRLGELGEAGGGGLLAALFAATALYTWQMTGEQDLVVGMPADTRTNARLRRATGPLSNIMPLRLTVDPAGNALQLIRHCGLRIREALRHRRYWSSALRGDLGIAPNEPNIYGPTLNFLPEGELFHIGGRPAPFTLFVHSAGVQDFAITVHARRDRSDAAVQFDANAANYDRAALEAHARGFLTLLEALLESPESPVRALPAMTAPTAQRLVTDPRGASDSRSRRSELPRRLAAPGEVPQTPTEVRLAAIWSEVLRAPHIGRDDDFFALGGHSLLALQLAARIRDVFRIELPLKTLFNEPTLQGLAAWLDLTPAGGEAGGIAPIVPVPGTGVAPLSQSQTRMWLIQSLNPAATAYNMGAAMWLRGELDVAAFCDSFDELLARHEILRSRIQLIDGELGQVVDSARTGMLFFTDLRPHADAAAEAQRLARTDLAATFDLERGPVFRAQLLQTGETTFLFSLALHHAAADQWSMGLLGRELSHLYNRRRRGDHGGLEPLPISYRDFAQWDRSGARAGHIEDQLRFWRRQLADLPTLDLPVDLPRPRLWTMNGSLHQREIPPELFAALGRLAIDSGSTLFMTLLAGFAALLQRISGQSDLPIGVPVANRTLSAVEGLMGAFVNTVIIRADVREDPAFGELLTRVRRTALDAFANQDVSFDRLVQELAQRRDHSRAPLAQVMFNMINAPMHGIEFDGVTWELALLDRGGAQFELSFTVDSEISRSLIVEYNTDLFERGTIERLTEQYFALLESAARAPETPISRLAMLPERQRAALRRWNDTAVAFTAATFPDMFAEQAGRSAHRVAISFDGNAMTYGELDSRARALAGLLQRAGAGRGERVVVCVRRSPQLIVSLLAVQRSGSAYVPLDPDFPPERLRYMLADSGAKVVLTSGPLPPGLTPPEGVTVIDVVTAAGDPGQGVKGGPLPQDAAYVLYTSGSTGRPKGVTVSHGALANFLQSMRVTPGLSESDVVAAVTTVSFDIAGLELYLPLLVGARIELVPRGVASDGASLEKLLDSAGATLLQATPATWQLLVSAGWHGSPRLKALCGGEALSRKLADEILDRVAELWNMYGPTETTIWSTVERVERGSQAISIGRPIGNTRVHVLDESGELAPIGVVGEICIAGAGLADGYHGLPALTAERFVADAHSGVPGGRLYRTGDLGRWGGDGKLYHLGRSDHQVKLRGFRIELGEIEHALTSHPAVRHAVAAVRQAGPEDPRLVAYVVQRDGEEVTFTEIRRHLRGLLPDYMIPTVVMPLLTLPLSPNGKLDRSALPDPFATPGREEAASEPPPSGLEQQLAQIWMSVLKVPQVGRSDNFFELGGYSLLALRVARELDRRAARRLDPRALFFHNLREVAEMLERDPAAAETVPR